MVVGVGVDNLRALDDVAMYEESGCRYIEQQHSEHKRAKYLGRVFQDPMMGTAATMQIEENLALAARRGKPRTLRPGITKAEREEYRERLKILEVQAKKIRLADTVLLPEVARQTERLFINLTTRF